MIKEEGVSSVYWWSLNSMYSTLDNLFCCVVWRSYSRVGVEVDQTNSSCFQSFTSSAVLFPTSRVLEPAEGVREREVKRAETGIG